jgi:Uncharacterised nucleotidyltransferase
MNGAAVVSGGAGAERLVVAAQRVARELALDCALAELVSELDRRAVPSLLLKGPVLARWLYEDVTERPYGDIDLLIAPDRFEAARRCVLDLGFERHTTGSHPHENAGHHEIWVAQTRYPAVVELHRTLYLLTAEPALVWQRLSADAQTIQLAGAPVRVPGAAALALIVGLHAAQHGRQVKQPMQDLEQALEHADVETWRAAAGIADELGALPDFSAGVRLTPRGRQLAQVLGMSGEPPRRSVRLLAATPPDTAFGIERLITTSGVRSRVTLLMRELVPSPGFMRSSSRLARRGTLGLVGAYLVRPVWLALKLPRGTAAWLRAATPAAHKQPRRKP